MVCRAIPSRMATCAGIPLAQEACDDLVAPGVAPSAFLQDWDPLAHEAFDPLELDCHGKSYSVNSLIGASGCWKSTCELADKVLAFLDNVSRQAPDLALYIELLLGGFSGVCCLTQIASTGPVQPLILPWS